MTAKAKHEREVAEAEERFAQVPESESEPEAQTDEHIIDWRKEGF